jgi:hypothetical protein
MQSVEIRVKGQIDKHWSDWFDDLDITHTDQDETILTGDITDQSALYGVIAKLRDLGLPLISVNSTEIELGKTSHILSSPKFDTRDR